MILKFIERNLPLMFVIAKCSKNSTDHKTLSICERTNGSLDCAILISAKLTMKFDNEILYFG